MNLKTRVVRPKPGSEIGVRVHFPAYAAGVRQQPLWQSGGQTGRVAARTLPCLASPDSTSPISRSMS